MSISLFVIMATGFFMTFLSYLECAVGTYGQDCGLFCDCENSAGCDSETGECICADGWSGPRCENSKSSHIVAR